MGAMRDWMHGLINFIVDGGVQGSLMDGMDDWMLDIHIIIGWYAS